MIRLANLLGLLLATFAIGVVRPCHSQDQLGRPTTGDAALSLEVDAAGAIGSTTSQIHRDLEYLASDDLRGRGVGDESIDRAARYVAQRMSEIGLEADTPEESLLQPFDVLLGARAAGADVNHMTVTSDNGDSEPLTVSLGNGFGPLEVGSPKGSAAGPLVFAGYGITAPKFDYDDYVGVNTAGAVVMILRKEPQQNNPNSRFMGTRNTPHALFATKIENAIKHGAAAVVLVNDADSVMQGVQNVRSKIVRENERREAISQQLASLPAGADNSRATLKETLERIEQVVASLEVELQQSQRGVLDVSEAGSSKGNEGSIPVVTIGRDVADRWLKQYVGRSLETIEAEIDESGSPRSVPLAGASASLVMELESLNTRTSNVIGVLPGKGELSDQTIVVGAHYDHVGMGGIGSLAPGSNAVHNGADDNASGTAALLGAAERVSMRLTHTPSHRRVVFIAFSAEERGLLGSVHYVAHPRFPLDATVAMVNLDMVGRLRDNELTVYGTGSSPALDLLVDEANSRQAEPFQIFKVPTGYGPSDHQSFYEAGIPVLFFFTGLHNDYHRPSDDFDKIDFGGLTRITDIVSDVTWELAVRSERPVYTETDRGFQIRRQLTAFMGVKLSDRDNHVVVSEVVAGGPADKVGIKVGDRMERLGDQPVRSASQVVDWVRARSPGDRAKVLVTRVGIQRELTIQLAERP